MEATIELFTPKYQDAVKDFIIETWKEFDFPFIPEEDADLENIQKYYLDNRGVFYILRKADTVLGTIGALSKSDTIAELTRLYVDKSEQGHGYGSQLVDHVIQFCSQNGYKKIELNTNKIFAKAHKLYLSKGFEITKEDDQDFYMDKILSTIDK